MYIINHKPMALLAFLLLGHLLPAQGLNSFRISFMGNDGDGNLDAFQPDVIYNATEDEYLVVWSGELLNGDNEIFGQRIEASTGTLIGPNFQISEMGGMANTDYDGLDPKVEWNLVNNEYLVVWHGDDSTGGLADGENEIWGQRLDATGNEIGDDDFRISFMGTDGDNGSDAFDADLAYNYLDNYFVVVWSADDSVGGEDEIYAQAVDSAGNLIGAVQRVSNMGPNGSGSFDADRPDIVYNELEEEFLIVWDGDDNTLPLVDGELEIYVRRYSASPAFAPVDTARRISDMGPVGSGTFDANNAEVDWNDDLNQYLVVWAGEDSINSDFNIHGQLLDGIGNEIGVDDFLISNSAPVDSSAANSNNPSVAYNSECLGYLVAFNSDSIGNGRPDNKNEIFIQRLDNQGNLQGVDTVLTAAGGRTDAAFDAFFPAVAFSEIDGSYLVVNSGDDSTGALIDNELEIFGNFLGRCCLAPELICPPSIVEAPTTLDCNPVINWNPAQVFDGCEGVALSSTAMSGDNFPVGTTNVFFTGVDSAGNQDSCGFSVTVLQPMLSGAISINGDTLCATLPNLTYQWLLNGMPIANANQQCYVPLTTGNYAVEITDSGCTGVSDTTSVLVSLNPGFAGEWVVYPNPAQDEVRLRWEGVQTGRVEVRLMDLSGRVLWQQSGEGVEDWVVGLQGLSEGLYLLEVLAGNGRMVQKLEVLR